MENMEEIMAKMNEIEQKEKESRENEVRANFDFNNDLANFIQTHKKGLLYNSRGKIDANEFVENTLKNNDLKELKSLENILKTSISYFGEKSKDEEGLRFMIKLRLMRDELIKLIDSKE